MIEAIPTRDAGRDRPLWPLYALIALTTLTIIAIWVVGVFVESWGYFSYSLDDPYIHLALAERLAHGHYGLNPGEPASPSSSIIYPFLLAGLLWCGFGQYGPLLICSLSAAAANCCFFAIWDEAGISLRGLPRAGIALLTVCIMLGFNFLGLASTGLEHSLHVAVTLACLLGVVRLCKRGRFDWWLPVCLIANPGIRYEGMSICVAGALILCINRKYLAGALTLLGGIVLVVGFSLFMLSIGLPFLPSSVLVQSVLVSSGVSASIWALPLEIGNNIFMNIRSYCGLQLAVMAIFLAGAMIVGRRPFREMIADKLSSCAVLFALLVTAGHMAFGECAMRYVVYAVATDVAALAVVWRAALAEWMRNARGVKYAFIVCAGLMLCCSNVLSATKSIDASYEIYAQQYQMHRFVTEFYKAPVAVNDLGWVSYDNPYYVLDLWGLGSEPARLARAAAKFNPGWMNRLTESKKVGLAMIYPNWFPFVPSSWVAIGRLVDLNPPIVVGGTVVVFFATAPEYADKARAALSDFQGQIPEGSRIDIFPPDGTNPQFEARMKEE